MARPQVWTPGAAVRQGHDSDGEIRPTEGGGTVGRPVPLHAATVAAMNYLAEDD